MVKQRCLVKQGKELRFSDVHFAILTIYSFLRISSAMFLQLEQLYSHDKVHKQSSGNTLAETASCFKQGFLFLLHKVQLASSPQTLPSYRHLILLHNCGHVQWVFQWYWGFFTKGFHFHFFVILSAGNHMPWNSFFCIFFSPKGRKNKQKKVFHNKLIFFVELRKSFKKEGKAAVYCFTKD